MKKINFNGTTFLLGLMAVLSLVLGFIFDSATGAIMATVPLLALPENVKSELEKFGGDLREKLKGMIDEATNGSREALESLKGELSKLTEKNEALQRHADELDIKLQKGAGSNAPKSFIQQLKSALTDGLKGVEKGKSVEIEVKAINNASFTGEIPAAQMEAGINKTPKKANVLRALLFNGTTTSDTVGWVEKTNQIGAPIPLAEEAAFPEIAITYEKKTTPVKKIGGKIKVTEEQLADVEWLTNEIQQELVENMDDVVDTQILSGTGVGENLRGILADATAFAAGAFAETIASANRFDVLRVAYNQVITAKHRPNAYVLHPTDVAKMELTKDANNNYVMPPFSTADGTQIKGLPVIESLAVTEGDFLIGDFSKAGAFSRGGMVIEFGYENDDFSKDLRTVKVRERLALRIKGRDFGAFVKGTFSTAIAALDPAIV
jgi:HK97 family phage major capsid protein